MSLLPASMKRIRSKTAEKTWWHCFPHYKSMGILSTLKGSLLCSPWSDLVKFRTHVSSYICHRYLQVSKISDQKQPRKRDDALFPIISLWVLSVAMETKFLIWSAPKPNAAFPPPNDASYKIWLRSAYRSQRYSCLKVWTHARTHTRMDGRTDAGSSPIL